LKVSVDESVAQDATKNRQGMNDARGNFMG